MASSSSNPSSTSSSTTSTPSTARVPSDSERARPRFPTHATAPAASAALRVAPGASASAPNLAPSATAPGFVPGAIASASALNVAPGATAPDVSSSTPPPPPGTRRVPPPTNFAREQRRGGRAPNSARPQHVSHQLSHMSRWERAADPMSTFAPERWSAEGSSPTDTRPASAASSSTTPVPNTLSKSLPWLRTAASTPTDTRTASAVSSSTTLVPNASGSAPAVARSADTGPEPDASTSSAADVARSADHALVEPDAFTSASSSAPGVATIVDASLEPAGSNSTPSSATTSAPVAARIAAATTSAPGAGPTASASTSAPVAARMASAMTSAPGAGPTIPGLRDSWAAEHRGLLPRSVERCPGQQAFGGRRLGKRPRPTSAPDAMASTSTPGISRSLPLPPPLKRRRRDPAPDSRGTPVWADLPMDILEMVFVKLTGSALASAHVCYRWRISAMSFPRPVVLRPARSGRMELLVPSPVMPRGPNIATSVGTKGCRPFSYMILPALNLRSHLAVRLIGGSPSVPLLMDDCHRRLVARRLVGSHGGSPNALPETLLSINLPEGVASHDIYCGIFAVGSRNTSFDDSEEINKIKGVLLATKSCIYGILVKDCRESGNWRAVQMPLAARQKDRKFMTAASFGGFTYFLDQTNRLLACNMDLFGEIHTDELSAGRNQLLDQHMKVLKSWIMHLSLGKASEDSCLLCLRYEYYRPCWYKFAAYDLELGEVRQWRVRQELRDFCIFIGWGPGAEAFVYWHPERIGLASGAIYDTGMRPYFLRTAYRYNAMPPLESFTWPFPIWIQQSFSVPYVPLPRRGIIAEALPPPAGDGVDAEEKGRHN